MLEAGAGERGMPSCTPSREVRASAGRFYVGLNPIPEATCSCQYRSRTLNLGPGLTSLLLRNDKGRGGGVVIIRRGPANFSAWRRTSHAAARTPAIHTIPGHRVPPGPGTQVSSSVGPQTNPSCLVRRIHPSHPYVSRDVFRARPWRTLIVIVIDRIGWVWVADLCEVLSRTQKVESLPRARCKNDAETI